MEQIIKVFHDEKYGNIQTILVQHEPMYSFKDLCKVLVIKDQKKARESLNQNGLLSLEIEQGDTKIKGLFVNEANMQKLYPKAEDEDVSSVIEWIANQVIPRARLYGSYTVDDLIGDPDKIVNVLKENANLNLKVTLLENKITQENYRVKHYTRLYGERESVALVFLAEYLAIKGISQSRIMELLRGQDILQPNDLPYQKYVDSGYFRIDEHRYYRGGELEIRQTALVYKAGINFIKKLFLKVAGEIDCV
jgi:prophage antirepressor-like protein